MKQVIALILLISGSLTVYAQSKKLPKPQTITVTSGNDSIDAMLDDYERIQLPPLSVFLESVDQHPSVKIYEARRDAAHEELKVTRYNILNNIRGNANYQYGRMVALNSSSASDVPFYQTSTGISQNQYFVGVSLSVPLGDLLSQKHKVRAKKAQFREMEYDYAITKEERKLVILEAYNRVLQELATLKAKSEAAALYNAQMKISEQDFINGKIDIISLSLERSRRSNALVTYQSGRVALQNAITLLEMLTNVKIMK